MDMQAPRLHYVHPTCFEAGKPMEFVACGSHLRQPKFRYYNIKILLHIQLTSKKCLVFAKGKEDQLPTHFFLVIWFYFHRPLNFPCYSSMRLSCIFGPIHKWRPCMLHILTSIFFQSSFRFCFYKKLLKVCTIFFLMTLITYILIDVWLPLIQC